MKRKGLKSLLFGMIPINYRPIRIDGFMEASYPSSTTLLVLSVMPTLWFQTRRRLWSINTVSDDCGKRISDL